MVQDRDWRSLPEHALLGRETLELLEHALEGLPATQRTVVTLRDIYGCSAEEVCATLGLTEIRVHDRMGEDTTGFRVAIDDLARRRDLSVGEHVVLGGTGRRRQQSDRGLARTEHQSGPGPGIAAQAALDQTSVLGGLE